jgi:lipopolysaccharide export system protein LptC
VRLVAWRGHAVSVRDATAIIALIALAVVTWYYARSLQGQDEPTATVDAGQTGFYVKSARILGTNPEGHLLYEIESEYAEQLPTEEVEFRNVEIRYSSQSDVPWRLTADRAVIGDDRQKVTLTGHVVAISEVGFEGRVTEIRTPYLELEPETFRAQTDDRVQIRIGARSITATGMRALLQSSELHLLSNVSGKFAP